MALHPSQWKELFTRYREIIMYVIFGALTTLVSILFGTLYFSVGHTDTECFFHRFSLFFTSSVLKQHFNRRFRKPRFLNEDCLLHGERTLSARFVPECSLIYAEYLCHCLFLNAFAFDLVLEKRIIVILLFHLFPFCLIST